MAVLLTIAAVIVGLLLLVSATGIAARATGSAASTRGPWGIAQWSSTRRKPLSAQERRWQTALLSARDNPSRWRDVVVEIERLERASGATPHSVAPQEFNADWVQAKLTQLEAHAAASSPPGDNLQ